MRRLKAILLALAALAGVVQLASPAAAQQAAAVDPARLDLGRQIITIMYPPEKRQAMAASLVDNVLAQFRASMSDPATYADPGMKKILDDAFNSIPQRLSPAVQAHLPRLLEAMARAYAREFSAAELQETLAFARTPSGRHYLQSSPTIMADRDIAAANTTYFSQVQQVSQQISADFRREVTTYLQAHPDLAARLRAQSQARPGP
jgi:hypothetical protein